MIGRLASAFLGPIGLPVVLVLAAMAAAGFFYRAGYSAAEGQCQAEKLRQERDAARRDLAIAEEAARLAAELAEGNRLRAEDLNRKVDEYAASLDKTSACRLGADDVRRLRNIK